MGQESVKMNFPSLEEGGKKIDTEWLQWRIKRIFRDADMNDKCYPLWCNRMWRRKIGDMCTGLPFSKLLSAFHKRYGVRIMQNYSSQLTLHENRQNITAGGSDFPDNCSDLDFNAIEEILKRLPVPSLMRAKTVCKDWNAAISATNFNPLNVEDNQLFVTQHMMQDFEGIAFFDSALNQWFRIPLLPHKRWCSTWNYHDQIYLCATAAGLYLFLHWDDMSQNNMLAIVNPVTDQCMELPSLPDRYGLMKGTAMELIAQPTHFDIIALGLDKITTNYCTLHYNSLTDEWTGVLPAMPADLPYWRNHSWTSSLHNGIVYFTRNYGLHLGCYDIASKEFQFKEVEGGLPPGINYLDDHDNFYASLPSLVVCNGKLLLVGRSVKGVEGSSTWGGIPFIKHTLVGIWELDNNGKVWSWSRVCVTPKDLFEDTVKSSHGTDFMVAASSDKIWLTIRGSTNILVLDMKSMKWNVLPGCPTDDIVDTFPRSAVFGTFSINKPSLFH